jgi:hypothetical protein
MKKSLLAQILVLSAALIVLTALVPVNPALLPATQPGSALAADGVPLPLPEPPPPPPPHLMSTENQARSTNTMRS